MAGKKKVNQESAGGFVVVSPFRDINDFNKVYGVGEDVSHFDKDRLLSLIEKKLVVEGSDVDESSENPE